MAAKKVAKKAARRCAIKTRQPGSEDVPPARLRGRKRSEKRVVRNDGRTGALNGPTVQLLHRPAIPPVNAEGFPEGRDFVLLNPAQVVTLMAASNHLYQTCYYALRALDGKPGYEQVADELRLALREAYKG